MTRAKDMSDFGVSASAGAVLKVASATQTGFQEMHTDFNSKPIR